MHPAAPHPAQPRAAAAAAGRARVAVYRGEGAGWRSVQSAVASISRLLPPDRFLVDTMATRELLAGGWQARVALLVMPGGADLPYCKHLNGAGNALIRDYVSGGGSYLGICAGAYYACARVEFEAGSAMEVIGERELCFFPGVARGAVVPGFDYQTERGAAAVPLEFLGPEDVEQLLAGRRRQQQEQQQQEQQQQQQQKTQQPQQQQRQQQQHLAADSNPPQSTSSNCSMPTRECSGRSNNAHTDVSSSSRWRHAIDYCNGGPFFVAPDGAADWDKGGLPGVDVLARYVDLPQGALTRVQPRQAAQEAEQQRQQQQQEQEKEEEEEGEAAGRETCGSGCAVRSHCRV
ncbi:biotin--protein ligase [Monoraphidium neglectum]|uniref:Biotin--protein ligase n=1 Tax=Monoraphidium neglectum TaxID=145388 RepID=A0A0D2LGV6_9CHLO|nr:biotin--protein ligase [Monoraphidium neglectum]KIZ05719.1 biotin--protein ligase [Monoraphidium neglectum]|eukprot:XP_013904738.1 biotin--protein ligase [Monoraphidium neglectum]